MRESFPRRGVPLVRTPRRRPALAAVATLALTTNLACYSYARPMGGVMPSGSDVLIELTVEGSGIMQPAVGPRVHLIEGHVADVASDGTATVNIESVTSRDGLTVPYAGRDAVRVPRAAVLRTDVRTFDRKRSWMAAGAITGAFLIVVITVLEKARSRASGSGGKVTASPPELRIP